MDCGEFAVLERLVLKKPMRTRPSGLVWFMAKAVVASHRDESRAFTRLSEHVIRVFLEATPDQTEQQLLHGLRRACPDLPRYAPLVVTFPLFGRGKGIPAEGSGVVWSTNSSNGSTATGGKRTPNWPLRCGSVMAEGFRPCCWCGMTSGCRFPSFYDRWRFD